MRPENGKGLPKVGDVVTVEGCHDGYRPILRRIEGLTGYVSSFQRDEPIPVPLSKLKVVKTREARP